VIGWPLSLCSVRIRALALEANCAAAFLDMSIQMALAVETGIDCLISETSDNSSPDSKLRRYFALSLKESRSSLSPLRHFPHFPTLFQALVSAACLVSTCVFSCCSCPLLWLESP